MGCFGAVSGLPFVPEGFAFFIEAIFVWVYLSGWDRLSPRTHILSHRRMIVASIPADQRRPAWPTRRDSRTRPRSACHHPAFRGTERRDDDMLEPHDLGGMQVSMS